MKISIVFILFSLLLSAPVLSAQPEEPWEANDLTDFRAPDFSLPDMEGKKVSLSEFRGKVILLNFWTTWCPPCREEIPSLESLSE